MSLSIEGTSQANAILVDTITVEGTRITGTNLSSLSSKDIEQLAQLSEEFHLTTDMASTSDLIEMENEEHVEVVETELGAHEVEIETERPHSPEEILPDIKIKPNVPPLRPLTIAPKPAKVPIALKPSSGQQLLLVQGGSAGQPLKILSPQGQGISLANLSLAKPISLRPAGKNIPGNVSVLQPKQVIMKKVIQTQKNIGDTKNLVLAEKIDSSGKGTQASIVVPSSAKTITLAQAQQIGLLTGAKLVPQVSAKQAIVVNKAPAKAIKLLPQGKSHPKILPAPQSGSTNKVAQRIILKQANTNSSLVSPGQIIQVSGNQPLLTGQLHQINIPGKGVQYIKIVTPTSGTDSSTKTLEGKLTVVTSGTSTKSTDSSGATSIAPKPLKATTISRANTVHIPSSGQLVVLPANYLPQPTVAKVPIPAKPATVKSNANETANMVTDLNLEANGMRPRKPCNCTKSQCLKLYCDCFANGEFCYLCNCMNCYNNLDNEEHRQRAIKSCLERNPNAFRPKIGKTKEAGDTAVRKHTKGCNCKRSGCLKNYCECYEAKIACSSNCKCLGCRNVEDALHRKGISEKIFLNSPVPVSPPLMTKLGTNNRSLLQFRPRKHSNNKYAFNFITDDVIEATSQCLLAISDSAEVNAQDEEETKKQIIEEFGRCLMEIIECSNNRTIINTSE